MDLGNSGQEDLAFDVDENMGDEHDDMEALESDDEDQLDEELGLDVDADGKRIVLSLLCV